MFVLASIADEYVSRRLRHIKSLAGLSFADRKWLKPATYFFHVLSSAKP
jgi:hypothetical protein